VAYRPRGRSHHVECVSEKSDELLSPALPGSSLILHGWYPGLTQKLEQHNGAGIIDPSLESFRIFQEHLDRGVVHVLDDVRVDCDGNDTKHCERVNEVRVLQVHHRRGDLLDTEFLAASMDEAPPIGTHDDEAEVCMRVEGANTNNHAQMLERVFAQLISCACAHEVARVGREWSHGMAEAVTHAQLSARHRT